MYNWSTDTARLKHDPDKLTKFMLEQRINFGLNGSKLKQNDLIKFWKDLDIDQYRKKYLSSLLWPK
ncbi:hypothetical protein A2W24_05990 [Microgenomates group bacterium RBG_16_45_19]|nr:MAG: hypothetical protein A2W24_05990 [Microgenomates group bacterium RBG_16_45_19]